MVSVRHSMSRGKNDVCISKLFIAVGHDSVNVRDSIGR